MKFPIEPREYVFSELDFRKFAKSHYRFPCRLVTDGTWAKLWQPSGKKGGGSIASILPVLALSSYPGAPSIAPSYLPCPDPAFTPWGPPHSIRRIAKLAGLSEKTAASGMRSLARAGFAEVKTMPCRESSGGRRTWYRLSRKLFPEKGELFSMISGGMIYSGTWSFLPTAATRHLYMALAAQDPVRDEAKLLAILEEEHSAIEPEEQAAKIGRMRERKAVSWSMLAGLTGFTRSTLAETLPILTTPIFDEGSIPLVRVGGRPGRARWYAIDNEKRAAPWMFTYGQFNCTKDELAKKRLRMWPVLKRHDELPKRHAKPRRSKPTRRRALALAGT